VAFYSLQGKLEDILAFASEACIWDEGRFVRRFVCERLDDALRLQAAYSIFENQSYGQCPICGRSWVVARGMTNSNRIWCKKHGDDVGNLRKKVNSRLRAGMTQEQVADDLDLAPRAVDALLTYHGSAATQDKRGEIPGRRKVR
jgi:hypothetical protein